MKIYKACSANGRNQGLRHATTGRVLTSFWLKLCLLLFTLVSLFLNVLSSYLATQPQVCKLSVQCSVSSES